MKQIPGIAELLFSMTGFSAPVLHEENSSKTETEKEKEKTQEQPEKNGGYLHPLYQ